MELHTACEVISLAKRLESESAKFYQSLSLKYAKDKDILASFVKENERNITQIERAYYGAITDAIESCFAFNINPEEYGFKTELTENESYSEALDRAVEIEQKMVKFYSDAAEQSMSLMADVSKAFAVIVKKRRHREPELRLLSRKKGNGCR